MNNIEYIKEQGLIVIFRGVDIAFVPDLVRAIYAGGVRIVETTFDPSDPDTAEKTAEIIRTIYKTMGDQMLVGAGTVIDETYAVAAKEAGAKFLLSPDTNPDIIRLTKKRRKNVCSKERMLYEGNRNCTLHRWLGQNRSSC